MRPAAFQSRSVARCVCASTRLCTCIRSRRSTRSLRIESSIWRMPACRPLVQTLVATKSLGRMPRSAASCPVTCSEEPYIGELSTIRPPPSTKTRSVSFACASSGASPATSNTCQVPRPTAGSASPVFGMRRSSSPCPRDSGGITSAPRSAPAVLRPTILRPTILRKVRRESTLTRSRPPAPRSGWRRPRRGSWSWRGWPSRSS